MTRKLACVVTIAAMASVSLEGVAEAQEPAQIAGYSIAAVGGVASTIAAFIYMVNDRSFHSAWVIVSLVTSAMCLGTSIGLIPYAGDTGALIGVIGNVALAALPIYWTTQTALAEVEPGQPMSTKLATPGGDTFVVPIVSMRF